MDFLVSILIIVGLVAISGFFAGSETALFSLSAIEKRRLKDEHPYMSKWVLSHMTHPRRTLITILIGNLLVHILSTSLVTLIAIDLWGAKGVGPALGLFTIAMIFFGEIFPKAFAVRYNEAISMLISIPLRVFSLCILPIRALALYITNFLISFIIPHRKEAVDKMSEGELKVMIEAGGADGVLDDHEHFMIQNLLELNEKQAKDVMTPRIDLVGLNIEDSREEHEKIIQEYHISTFPVYRESMDNILGVVSAQKYMLTPEKELPSLWKQPIFVPETKTIDDLLTEP